MLLVIGNKNYSSWSLRPWLALKVSGIAFEEKRIPLDSRRQGRDPQRHSPPARCRSWSTATTTVWDSLAILEYLAEKHPTPVAADGAARARGAPVAAEMHSGFPSLRNHMPHEHAQALPRQRAAPPSRSADIERIIAIWNEAHGGRSCSAIRRRRRDVRAGGAALPHLRGRAAARRRRPITRPCSRCRRCRSGSRPPSARRRSIAAVRQLYG